LNFKSSTFNFVIFLWNTKLWHKPLSQQLQIDLFTLGQSESSQQKQMKTFSHAFFCLSAFNWLRFEQAMFSLTHWKVKSFCLTQSMFSYQTSLKRFKAFMKTCLPTIQTIEYGEKILQKQLCLLYDKWQFCIYIKYSPQLFFLMP